jgi:hypothetical protein
MKRFAELLRREGPATIAREAIWRTTKPWRLARFRATVEGNCCPVRYRPVGYYRRTVEQFSDSAGAALLRYADAVCNGEFPFYFTGPVKLGFPPQWNLDFVSGMTWPQEPSERLIAVRHDGSDVKTPWELSRLQFLPVLGKAWRLTRNERYRRAAMELTADWIEKNPVGVGVNWTIAMEAALRSLSMCLLFELLWPIREDEQALLEDVTRSLWQHLLFIEAHSEFSHLVRSNHYLSNIVGLLGLTTFLEGPGMDARQRRYARFVQQEILYQTYEDGGSYEASLGYHVLVTQMFASALLLMKASHLDLAPVFCERLRLMFGLMARLHDSHGRLPHVGDCDDGRVELLSDDLEQMYLPGPMRNSLVVSGLLGIGELLLGLPRASRWDDASWYGSFHQPPSAEEPQPRDNPTLFRASGIARLCRGEVDLLFFAMPNGIGGRGSHTHNDKLSILVRLNKHELLCDSGTACYTRDARIRNLFRSTEAHNCASVDGQEQNRIPASKTQLFWIGNEAQVSEIQSRREGAAWSLFASHCGYRDQEVVHARTARLTEEGTIWIEDEFTGHEEHALEIFFHFPPPWRVANWEKNGDAIRCTVIGPVRVSFLWTGPTTMKVQEEPWRISRVYGTTFDSLRIRVCARAILPVRVTTRIREEK